MCFDPKTSAFEWPWPQNHFYFKETVKDFMSFKEIVEKTEEDIFARKNDCLRSFERLFWRSCYQFCCSITQIIKTTYHKTLLLVLALLDL